MNSHHAIKTNLMRGSCNLKHEPQFGSKMSKIEYLYIKNLSFNVILVLLFVYVAI